MARRTAGRPSKTGASKKKATATSSAAARKSATAKPGKTRVKQATGRKRASTRAAKKAAPVKKTAARKAAPKKASPKKPAAKKVAPKKAAPKKAAPRPALRKKAPAPKKAATPAMPRRAGSKAVSVKKGQKKAALKPRNSSIDARRRELEETVPSPPSSLNMNRRGSAVRTGRAELAESRAEDAHFTPSINAGDEDVNVEDAYFTGDEAPGGDNPTPDQDIVDEIGRALGVEYQDNEELRGADKVEDRDRHRWELDPASAEDYRDRDKD